MFDQEILRSQVKADRFPFPCEGDITLAVHNKNYALGPVMLQLTMKPGSSIPAHVHEGVAEVLHVVEGEFINEGKRHAPETSLHAKAGTLHGPHSTESGCTILVLWSDKATTADANLDDLGAGNVSGLRTSRELCPTPDSLFFEFADKISETLRYSDGFVAFRDRGEMSFIV